MGRIGEIHQEKVSDLVPYANNARVHDDEQVEMIARSIEEFGFLNPVLIDKGKNVIAGHGRIMAAKKLGLETVPALYVEGLTEEQRRAYILADNRLTEIGGWNMEIVRSELDALDMDGYDISVTGFDMVDTGELENEERYTPKVDIPQYEPSGNITFVEELCDQSKTERLISEIKASGVSEVEKAFLIMGAYRHLRFDYAKVADYYANADPEMQELMEHSALVIVDIDNAIRDGYAELHRAIIGGENEE